MTYTDGDEEDLPLEQVGGWVGGWVGVEWNEAVCTHSLIHSTR